MTNKKGTIQQKKQELSMKEKLLMKDLNSGGDKLKRIGLWALGAGLIGLLFYGIYSSFADDKPKKKKKKKVSDPKEDNEILNFVIENAAPQIGKWIKKEFGN